MAHKVKAKFCSLSKDMYNQPTYQVENDVLHSFWIELILSSAYYDFTQFYDIKIKD